MSVGTRLRQIAAATAARNCGPRPFSRATTSTGDALGADADADQHLAGPRAHRLDGVDRHVGVGDRHHDGPLHLPAQLQGSVVRPPAGPVVGLAAEGALELGVLGPGRRPAGAAVLAV